MTDFHPVFIHRETGVRCRLVAQPSTMMVNGHSVSVGGVLATLDNTATQQLERDYERQD